MTRAARIGFLIGMIGGALEPLELLSERVLLSRLIFVGPDIVWLSPLMSGVLAAGAAMVALSLLRWVRPAWAEASVYAVPCAIVAITVLLHVPGVHRVALALVGLGLGLRLGAVLEQHGPRVDRMARMAWPLLLLLAVIGAAGVRVGARIQDKAAAPMAARDSRPNVLVVVLDTVRSYDVSAHGFEQDTTPFLKSLAARGTRFDQAYSVSPWTAPGHAGMFTGRWADELPVGWHTQLGHGYRTLADELSDLGYRTGAVVANTEYASREVLGQGFQFFSDYRLTAGRLGIVTALQKWVLTETVLNRIWLRRDYPERVDADEVTGEFMTWLDRGAGQDRFFAFLNYFDAHAPYHPPRETWDQFLPAGTPHLPVQVEVRDAWTPEQVDLSHQAYRAAVRHLDAKLAELFAQLDARGLLSNTIVIVTSDHGEEFYEHGVMGHGNSIHVQGLAVPLVMVWPGHIPAGRIVNAPVSTRQIPATIMSLLGESAAFPGPSLDQSWRSDAVNAAASDETLRFEVRYAPGLPAAYPVSGGTLTAVLQSGFWHLASPTGHEELYDAVADRRQTHDIIADPKYLGVLNRMRQVHEAVMPEWFEPPSTAPIPATPGR